MKKYVPLQLYLLFCMSTILFDQIVYGPVHSRRLGVSLGINLSPTDGKRCTFDCIYCECGFNAECKARLCPPTCEEVSMALTGKLIQLKAEGAIPDRITFSGNGEPTMHADFAAIIDKTLEIRDAVCPSAKIAVLSNSTMLHKVDVVKALCRIDENIMKLDAATDELVRLIDQPVNHDLTVRKIIDSLRIFNGKLIIQTMFLKGGYNGVTIDNTCDETVDLWIEAIKTIRPEKVMIYTVSRETPVKTLQKISPEALENIARKVRDTGFTTYVSV